MTTLQTNFVDIDVAGKPMRAYSARPKTDGKIPAVIVFQEAFGVNSHIQHVADRIAALGYHAIAPELFHRAVPAGFTAGYDEFPKIMPIFKTITEATLREDAEATYAWLKKQSAVDSSKVAAIGFCLGGRATYIANAFVPLRAALAYYGGGIQDLLHLAPEQKSPIHFFWGGKDAHITAEHRTAIHNAMTNTGKTFSEVVYEGADHAFSCDERAGYQPEAAQASWLVSIAIFENAFKN
jgi:carboxymethylenebutenolidase